MQTIRAIVMTVLACTTTMPVTSFSTAMAEQRQAHLLTLVNGTFDSVTGLAVASAGSDAFETIKLDNALPGGLAATTVDIPAGGCRWDVRVIFRNGRSQVFPSLDICRSHTLRLSTGRQPGLGGI